METAENKPVKLKEEKRVLLNELYFLSSFQNLTKNSKVNPEAAKKTLKTLIDDKLVKQMVFDSVAKDYVDIKPSNNSADKFYVMTKKGLINHIYG